LGYFVLKWFTDNWLTPNSGYLGAAKSALQN